ncbi:MAG TPA: phosphoribosylamine--glycine ligase N-terminal domain-containing protein, partial [Burkholderiales bacterium]
MKLLVIGGGGREHALAWKLAQSPRIQKVFVAPGNAGTARENGLENLPLTDIQELARFAQKEHIHFTAVGTEA